MSLGGCPYCGSHPHHSIGCPIARGMVPAGRWWSDEEIAEHDAALVADKVRLSGSLHMMLTDRNTARAERDAAREQLRAAEATIADAKRWASAQYIHAALAEYPVSPTHTERLADAWDEACAWFEEKGNIRAAVAARKANPYRATPTEET